MRDPSQVSAIREALSVPLLVISGGPGTGKTSLLVNMLRTLVGTGTDPSRILLAAPSGRAAQRMIEAMTVHQSPGSDFHDALPVLPDDASHRLPTREIVDTVYKAATRASRRMIVRGSAAAFQAALKRKIHRQSGLMVYRK